ncbi:MAG: DUF3025 domain-containing protein [Betaproteobacteria bacterium]|nr:DUF3025 domain-containing protein [Betaproteobacteria bacterium]
MDPEVFSSYAWFKPWRLTADTIVQAWHQHPDALHACLAAKQTDFVAVPQTLLPSDEAYEAFIYRTHTVPTRNNAHDFFNGLCWLRFPQTKQQLNRLQAQAIQKEGVTAQRGALRDALTLFDENAALLCAPEVLWQALKTQDWQALFVTHRQAWHQAHLTLFGHALLEKLLKPYKGITAHVLCVPVPVDVQAAGDAALDAWLSQRLHETEMQGKPFLPLPVLGVPAWWPPNEDMGFYADPQVFRPQKKQGY